MRTPISFCGGDPANATYATHKLSDPPTKPGAPRNCGIRLGRSTARAQERERGDRASTLAHHCLMTSKSRTPPPVLFCGVLPTEREGASDRVGRRRSGRRRPRGCGRPNAEILQFLVQATYRHAADDVVERLPGALDGVHRLVFENGVGRAPSVHAGRVGDRRQLRFGGQSGVDLRERVLNCLHDVFLFFSSAIFRHDVARVGTQAFRQPFPNLRSRIRGELADSSAPLVGGSAIDNPPIQKNKASAMRRGDEISRQCAWFFAGRRRQPSFISGQTSGPSATPGASLRNPEMRFALVRLASPRSIARVWRFRSIKMRVPTRVAATSYASCDVVGRTSRDFSDRAVHLTGSRRARATICVGLTKRSAINSQTIEVAM
jgi:hypothetical protein